MMGDARPILVEDSSLIPQVLVEDSSLTPQVLKSRGNEAYTSRDFNQAISLWRAALSLYPKPVEACIPIYSNIAGTLLLLGDYQGCCAEATAGIDCFERVLEGPRLLRGKLLVRRAEAQDHLGDWERALRDYTEGIALWDESSTSIYRQKANKLYQKIFGGPEYPFVEESTTGKYLAFGPDQRRQALVFRPRPHPPTSLPPPNRVHMTYWSHEDNLYCWGGVLLEGFEKNMRHVVPQDPQTLFVYSALTGEWREVLPTATTFFPNPRASGAAVVWEGCCYMHSGRPKIGPPGDRRNGYYSKWGMLSVWQLDLTKLKWTEYWKFNDPKKEVKKKRNMQIAQTYEAPACAVTRMGKMLAWGGYVYDFDSILHIPDYGVTNLLRIFDIPSKTWTTVQGSHSPTGAPLPAPRQYGVGWVHENCFYVFGGHWIKKNTGTKISGVDVELAYATNNLDRYDLGKGGWESIPMMGDHPPPLQEAGCVPVCSPEMAAKLPDGRPAVFIFGGFIMTLDRSFERTYGLEPARWPPGTLATYLQDHYRLDLNTLHWSRLHQVGNVRPLGIAEPKVFAPASAPHRLVLTQGYGFHPLRTEEKKSTEYGFTGFTPVVFDNTFDIFPSACPLTQKGVLCPISEASRGAGEPSGIWYRSPHQVEPQRVDWRGLTVPPEDEQFERESGWTSSDGFGPRKLFVMEYKDIEGEFRKYFDAYFGPSAKILREISTTRFRKGVGGILSRDGHHGLFPGEVCLEDASQGPAVFRGPPQGDDLLASWIQAAGGLPQRDELLAAWIQARAARQHALGEALTATYRGRRRQEARGLVLLVELQTARPRVWRRVRVGSRLTLRQLHDVVLCPAVGWQRAYHSYAFRELRPGERHDDDSVVWFGNPGEGQERTVDMIQVPFFYGGALVNDKDLVVDSMFEREGSRLAYVYDLGHYWWHSITLESYCTEDSVALLDGWGQAVPEDTAGGSWNYCSLLSELLPDTPALPNQSPLSVHEWWAKYWDLLDATNDVGTPATFDPCHFDLELHQRKLAEALRSRVSKYDGRFNPVPGTETAKAAAMGGRINRDHLHVNDPLPEARQRCAVCGVGAGLHGCAGCGRVYYCSKEHQKVHWKEHKPACASTANKKKKKKKKEGTEKNAEGGEAGPHQEVEQEQLCPSPSTRPSWIAEGSKKNIAVEDKELGSKIGGLINTTGGEQVKTGEFSGGSISEAEMKTKNSGDIVDEEVKENDDDGLKLDSSLLDDCWDEIGM